MSLIKEDGSGLSTANSYVDGEEARVYHNERGHEDWASAATASQDAALIRATAYVEDRWRGCWKGQTATEQQALAWPRQGVMDAEGRSLPIDQVPAGLGQAVCEAALLALSSDLQAPAERGGRVSREKVDLLEVAYEAGAPQESRLPAVEGKLRGLLLPGGPARALVRS